MILGKYLYSLRTSRSLSLREVAAAIDIDPGHLCDVEHDRLSLNRDRLSALAKLYNVPEAKLRKMSDEETSGLDASELLDAVKMAYRKHHLGDDTIAWDELSEKLLDALCSAMGSDGYLAWSKPYGQSREE